MNEKQQITYMQVRLIRLASEEWKMSIKKVAEMFTEYKVLEYIRQCFALFHVEGDLAVLEDVKGYLSNKGVRVFPLWGVSRYGCK